MKKNFLPDFEPARLVRGHRWYIVWYCLDDLTGERQRFRQTFNLNRIKDGKMREQRAADLVAKINHWIGLGLPISQFTEAKAAAEMRAPARDQVAEVSTLAAIELARDILIARSDRKDSHKTYRSMYNMLSGFLEEKRWLSMPVGEFRKAHAVAFLDDRLLKKKVSATTYNNYLTFYRSFWTELEDRGYVVDNPWTQIKMKPKRKIQKLRRNFTDVEARTVIRRIRQESELLFYALLLEYCCFVRPKELRMLRFQDVDIRRGLVRVTSYVAKNWEERVVTIPDAFLQYFRAEFFGEYPGKFYIFGKDFQPSGVSPCGHGTMYRKHRRVLEELHRSGDLESITGLTWYSWKDTGITDALDDLPIPAVQDQAGHHSPDMTMKYRHKRQVNTAMKGMKNRLL